MFFYADPQVPILDDGVGVDRYENTYTKMIYCIVIMILILFTGFILKYNNFF